MQKKLIAAAVAALVSTGAMADVTMYGRADFGYRSTDVDTTNGAGVTSTTKTTNTSWNAGSLTTSRLGWNISEDLGGGLTAFGNLETAINNLATSGGDSDFGAAQTDLLNTRLAYVGLKSAAAGAFTIGRQTTLVDSVLGVGSVGGLNNTTGTMYGDLGKLNNTRSSNLLQYASPNFSGFSFAVQYGNSKVDTAGSVNEMDELGLSLQYSAGPLTVALGHSSEELTAANVTTSEPTQTALAGSYDLGVAKIYALYMDGDNTAAAVGLNGRDGIEVGAKFPLGAVNLFASFFTGESDGVAAADDRDHQGFQLGALYSLSKRTTAYALYGSSENETQNALNKVETSTLALGIRHDF